MAVAAFLVCAVTAFFTQRAEHGRTSSERSAYSRGEKVGLEAATTGNAMPTDASLDMIAQEHFVQNGSGEPMAWKGAFANGYRAGFRKTHERR